MIDLGVEGDGPKTHALVIGVGRYRYFPGSEDVNEHLTIVGEQLESPPVCAVAFADWLLAPSARRYSPPAAPLATVELLISGHTTQQRSYSRRDTRTVVQVEAATMANVKATFQGWRDRLNQHPGNVGLFYFAGHGFDHAGDLVLLLEDFGEDAENMFAQAININRTRRGMYKNAARHQYYFIDACQIGSTTARFEDRLGQTLIDPVLTARAPEGGMYRAAAPGTKAYAKPGRTSFYTAALLDALRGLGSEQDDQDRWVVVPGQLGRAVEKAFDELRRARIVEQYPFYEPFGSTPLHLVHEPPRVPVALEWRPEDAFALAQLCVRLGERVYWRRKRPEAVRWDITLPASAERYDVRATMPDCKWKTTDYKLPVDPPRVRKTLNILDAETQ